MTRNACSCFCCCIMPSFYGHGDTLLYHKSAGGAHADALPASPLTPAALALPAPSASCARSIWGKRASPLRS